MTLQPGSTFNSIHFPRTVEVLKVDGDYLKVYIETFPDSWNLSHTRLGFRRGEYFNLCRPVDTNTHTGAVISPDEKYRYALWRKWKLGDGARNVLFIGLNPSRANEHYNDPTITRCINFAKAWGYDGMYFGNLFAIRSPDPDVVAADLKAALGLNTNYWLRRMANDADKVVFCWGSWKFTEMRADEIKKLFFGAWCFGKTKDGSPKHPLYLKADSKLEGYRK